MEGDINTELINDAEVAGGKSFTKCLMEERVPKSWKNVVIVLIFKKCRPKDLKLQACQLAVCCLQLVIKINNNQNLSQVRFKPAQATSRLSRWILRGGSHPNNQVTEKINEYRSLSLYHLLTTKSVRFS